MFDIEGKAAVMKTLVPSYYQKFKCIADRCRHSCCIGWEIDVDPDTLAYYDSLDGEIGKRITDTIDREGTPHFRLLDGDRCPHLTDCGLCSIISELGEGAICEICTEHPRYRVFLTDREEIGLGMCCEEACRIILSEEDPVSLVPLGGESNCEDGTGEEAMQSDTLDGPDMLEEDVFLIRDRALRLLQDRALPIDERIQRLKVELDLHFSTLNVEKWVGFYKELERLDHTWDVLLEAASYSYTGDLDEVDYGLPGHTAEQILVYFVLRHLGGAVHDGCIKERLKLALLSFYMIRAVAYTDEGKRLGLADVARTYSSEIEYSEDNLEKLIFELSF